MTAIIQGESLSTPTMTLDKPSTDANVFFESDPNSSAQDLEDMKMPDDASFVSSDVSGVDLAPAAEVLKNIRHCQG